jgi:hypothetical protein
LEEAPTDPTHFCKASPSRVEDSLDVVREALQNGYRATEELAGIRAMIIVNFAKDDAPLKHLHDPRPISGRSTEMLVFGALEALFQKIPT